MASDDKFKKATEDVKNLRVQPNEDELLNIYSLYKQAECGDINIPKPGMFDVTGKAKWEAWNGRKGLSKDEARKEYVDKSDELVKKYGLK